MADKIECELWIAMAEDGGWIVTEDESDALSKLAEEYGGNQARVVKITVKMTPPVMSEAEVTAPDEAGSVSLGASSRITTMAYYDKTWNRCDVCGRFIPIAEFVEGGATRTLLTPDSYFSKEEWETLCREHNKTSE